MSTCSCIFDPGIHTNLALQRETTAHRLFCATESSSELTTATKDIPLYVGSAWTSAGDVTFARRFPAPHLSRTGSPQSSTAGIAVRA